MSRASFWICWGKRLASTTSWIVMWVFLNFENGLVEFWWWFRYDVEYFWFTGYLCVFIIVDFVWSFPWWCSKAQYIWELMVLQISYHVRSGSGYESCCLLEVPWLLGPNCIKDWFGSLVGLLWVYCGVYHRENAGLTFSYIWGYHLKKPWIEEHPNIEQWQGGGKTTKFRRICR